ncbi:MAG TPA: helix-turn-helix transcriptional regulator [Thermomicrobiales bacterium]|jgi:DNA-binding PadR family transcriptional regulator
MTEPDDLTTTSYAILGQLALRSWSTYELAQEMRRNVHYFWPRAESRIYAEVKRLAARGLVRAERGFVGRRPRTTYAVTDAGRAAFVAWLATPPKPYALECEPLLRVFFGLFGDSTELAAAVDRARAQAAELLRMGDGIAREYAAGRAPFQDHLEVRGFVFDFLYGFARMVHDWADRTGAELAARHDLPPAARAERALAVIERSLAASSKPDPGKDA